MREQLAHGRASAATAASTHAERVSSNGQSAETEKLIQKVQSLMWQHVGVVRDGKALQQVVPELRAVQAQAAARRRSPRP